DVNGDGRPDLLLQFSMPQINEAMAVVPSTTMVELTAFTTRGQRLRGTDTVRIVNPRLDRAPVTVDDAFTTTINTNTLFADGKYSNDPNLPGIGVLFNDSDPDG